MKNISTFCLLLLTFGCSGNAFSAADEPILGGSAGIAGIPSTGGSSQSTGGTDGGAASAGTASAGEAGSDPVGGAGMATAGGSGGAPQAGTGGASQAGSGGALGGSGGTSTGGASTGGVTAGGSGGALAGTGGVAQGGSGSSSGMGGTGSGGKGGSGGTGGALGGSGGIGGAGGSGGSFAGSGGSTGGSGGGPDKCVGKLICDNFDTYTVGARPATGPWVANPDCTVPSAYQIGVSNVQSFSQPKSLFSQTPTDNTPCELNGDLGTNIPSDLYVRVKVRFAKATFPKTDSTQFDHNNISFASLSSATGSDAGIRFSVMGSNLCPAAGFAIHYADQDIRGCTSVVPAADQWYCIEAHVQSTATAVTTTLSIDGIVQAEYDPQTMKASTTYTHLGAMSLRYLNVGIRSYSTAYTTALYEDDVAVSTAPIGCE